MLQVGATEEEEEEEEEEDVNSVHTEKIGQFSFFVAKLVLPLAGVAVTWLSAIRDP
jgi:hypothetical protein